MKKCLLFLITILISLSTLAEPFDSQWAFCRNTSINYASISKITEAVTISTVLSFGIFNAIWDCFYVGSIVTRANGTQTISKGNLFRTHYIYQNVNGERTCQKSFSALLRPSNGGDNCHGFTNVSPKDYVGEADTCSYWLD